MPEPESTCPHCHAELEPEAKFCGACGRAVPARAARGPSAKGALEDTTPARKVPVAVTPSAASTAEPASPTQGSAAAETAAADADAAVEAAESDDSSSKEDSPSATPETDVARAVAEPLAAGEPESASVAAATDANEAAVAASTEANETAGVAHGAEEAEEPEDSAGAAETRDTTEMDKDELPSAGVRGTQMGIGMEHLPAKPASPAAAAGPAAAAAAPKAAPAAPSEAGPAAEAVRQPAPAQPGAGSTLKPSAALPVTLPPAKPLDFSKTLMGFDVNQSLGAKRAPVGSAEAGVPENPLRPLAKTMLGLNPGAATPRTSGPQSGASAPPVSSDSAVTNPVFPIDRAAGSGSASGTGARAPMARTMLGLNAKPASTPPPVAAAPAAASGRGIPQGTLMGLPIAPPAAPGEPASSAGDRAGLARTMLGMARLDVPDLKGAPPATGLQGGRTMLGVARPGSAADSGPGSAGGSVASDERFNPTDRVTLETASVRRNLRVLVPLFAATLLAVGATLYLLVRSAGESATDVSAKIVTTEAGEALLLEVPSAPAGAKVRFGGQEKPLQAGRASFALAADSLRVGDNLVLADVVQPDGSTKPVRITLAVFYRIWVDTAGLRAERPALDVIVTALPGTQVTLDGELLKLDEEGRGVRTYPMDVVSEAKGGVIEHVVRYRMQPPSGETLVDELRTRIPVAMMQIDKPGREVVTDRDSIEIAGAVAKDATLAIDGADVPVQDGRFLYRLKLPAPGDYTPRVVASAPGKAPLGITLKIKRVKDLSAAAADFAADPSITYAKLAGNPAIYRGQKIALEGRVYATDPRGAESVIQMFVRPCPKSRRCPIWVSDPRANDIAVDSWVRVLGVVQGEQQFRSEKNEIVTVPKIEAQFVLPAKP